MAADTRDKRFSMMGLAQPVPSIMADPDGTIGTQDRAQLLYLYSGIALSTIVDIWSIQDKDATSWGDQTKDATSWSDQTKDSTVWTVQ